MKEQNLDAPVYSENEQAVILVLKNNIEQRNVKQKITATDGGNNGGDFGGDFEVNTEKILNEMRANASAIIYSLAATATANGLNVEEYFTKLCRGTKVLPWNEN